MAEQRRFDIGRKRIQTNLRGCDLLRDPIFNKGTAFTERERDAFGLAGLLPTRVTTLDEQIDRLSENFHADHDALEKYSFLRALQDRNETLFYGFVLRRIEELVPIVYTPTVGTAVQRFSHIYERPRGLYINPSNVDALPEMLRRLPCRENVRLIVATDSEGILGIGDQGAGGMGIPIGKLSLYVLGAGIHPSACLPITLDVGTDNREHRDDPFYLGWRHDRLRGDAYLDFIERFAKGLEAELPDVLLQWEDFSKQNAFTLLDTYRARLRSFNDDIQGTGGMVLAGVLAATRITGDAYRDLRFVVHGAGAGGIGIARQLHQGLRRAGLSSADARRRILTLDSRGLITQEREGVEPYKTEFAADPDVAANWALASPSRITLLDVVRNFRPHALIGTSGQSGEFSKEIIRAMAAGVPMPIVFPLSNPTSKTEALPEDVYRWTSGNCVVATGSPFPPVTYEGATYRIGQGNNVFLFPGVGLGALVANATAITDDMLTEAAFALYSTIAEDSLQQRCIYPKVARLREVTAFVAAAVVRQAVDEGVAEPIPGDVDELVHASMWEPEYYAYDPV